MNSTLAYPDATAPIDLVCPGGSGGHGERIIDTAIGLGCRMEKQIETIQHYLAQRRYAAHQLIKCHDI